IPSVVVPLRVAEGDAKLVVVGGAFAPVFGSDELARLGQWAGEAGVALDRAGVIEELRTQTQTREWMLRAMSDLGEGVIVGNSERLAYVNEAYCEMLGYTSEELLAMPRMYDIVYVEDRPRAAENARRRRNGLATPDRY